MSESALSKASAILVGLSFFAITISPVFAVDEPIRAVVGAETRLTASNAAAIKAQLTQQSAEVRQDKSEEKIAALREKMASRAAALKTKLQAFKDKRKAEIAERLNANLNALNQNQTSQMQKSLGFMSTILDKLENRVNQGAADIKDPVATRAAITSAKTTIATASSATTAQSLKDYTMQVTSEARIGASAKLQRDKLHTDLLALRKTIIDARQGAANAISVARSGSSTNSASGSAIIQD